MTRLSLNVIFSPFLQFLIIVCLSSFELCISRSPAVKHSISISGYIYPISSEISKNVYLSFCGSFISVVCFIGSCFINGESETKFNSSI